MSAELTAEESGQWRRQDFILGTTSMTSQASTDKPL